MAAVLLDTTALVDLLCGRPGARRRLLDLRGRGDTPYVCAVNVEEITRGLRPSEEEPAAWLFEGLRLAPLGKTEGRRAGEWRRAYAKRGVTLSQADCLVAAAALSVRGRLATGNARDFPMDEVEVEHWPAGE